ncbi:MAG: DUF1588 domain-containing protein [Planctomycetaceae bacterium]
MCLPRRTSPNSKCRRKAGEGLTLRQLTGCTSRSTCANCHKVLDPIRFGLENFDAIGRWRDRRSGRRDRLGGGASQR